MKTLRKRKLIKALSLENGNGQHTNKINELYIDISDKKLHTKLGENKFVKYLTLDFCYITNESLKIEKNKYSLEEISNIELDNNIKDFLDKVTYPIHEIELVKAFSEKIQLELFKIVVQAHDSVLGKLFDEDIQVYATEHVGLSKLCIKGKDYPYDAKNPNKLLSIYIDMNNQKVRKKYNRKLFLLDFI